MTQHQNIPHAGVAAPTPHTSVAQARMPDTELMFTVRIRISNTGVETTICHDLGEPHNSRMHKAIQSAASAP